MVHHSTSRLTALTLCIWADWQAWASLVAQTVKNPPVMWETWVLSLGWEDPLEECKATHFSILAWRIPMDRGAWQVTFHGAAKSQTWLSDEAQQTGKTGMRQIRNLQHYKYVFIFNYLPHFPLYKEKIYEKLTMSVSETGPKLVT